MDTVGEVSYFVVISFFIVAYFISENTSIQDEFLILILVSVSFVYSNFIKDEITLYSQSQNCTDTDNCHWENNNRVTFKVIEETQQVVYWYKEQLPSMDKITDCKIRDRKNWWCEKKSGEIIGFFDSEWTNYKGGVQVSSSENFREVWLPWWWIYWVIESV